MIHFTVLFFLLSLIHPKIAKCLSDREDNSNLNYLYMDLFIGNTKIKQSFLLDTSIDVTTSICAPYSKITGMHQNNYYYVNKKTVMSCKDEKCFGYCDSNGNCVYDKSNGDELHLQSLITTQKVRLSLKDEKPINIP